MKFNRVNLNKVLILLCVAVVTGHYLEIKDDTLYVIIGVVLGFNFPFIQVDEDSV